MNENKLQRLEPEQSVSAEPFEFYSVPLERRKPKILLPAVLFAITVLTTLLAGIFLQIGFLRQAGIRLPPLQPAFLVRPESWLLGIPFSATILAILIAHELGHFLMCRRYGIDATYPYLLPAPPLMNPFGTFGAVIRIKSPFVDSRALFDVGIAGPIAGFVVLIPALIVGLHLSTVYQGRITTGAYEFGEPLLFQWFARLAFGRDGVQINLHPIGFAAWFGMLATSLNLLPIGQLDGGHVAFAALGPRGHRWISVIAIGLLMASSLVSFPMPGYLLFGIVLLFIGLKHPKPLRADVALGSRRLWLALLALAIFVLTFIMVPVRIV